MSEHVKMPDKYRQIVTSKCDWCGAEIIGLKTLKYCKPTNGKTKSICAIRAAAAQREDKKECKKGK